MSALAMIGGSGNGISIALAREARSGRICIRANRKVAPRRRATLSNAPRTQHTPHDRHVLHHGCVPTRAPRPDARARRVSLVRSRPGVVSVRGTTVAHIHPSVPTGVLAYYIINHPVPSPSIVSSAAASTSTAALTTTLRKQNVASKRGVALVPRVAGL